VALCIIVSPGQPWYLLLISNCNLFHVSDVLCVFKVHLQDVMMLMPRPASASNDQDSIADKMSSMARSNNEYKIRI
jgi:hypothetical protein